MTDPSPDARGFPDTRVSIVARLASGDPETRQRAFETLVAAYWKPVYKYIRLRWRAEPEAAEDLTQEFFLLAMEKGYLDRYDPTRAKFRTFLRVCVDGSVANARKAAARQKRGGGMAFVRLDFPSAEAELPDPSPTVELALDELFRRDWIKSLFELAIARLRAECAELGRELHFTLFERYDIKRADDAVVPTYAELATELGIPETQVTNFLALIRRRFRHHVLEALRELTAGDAEFAAEASEVLGAHPE